MSKNSNNLFNTIASLLLLLGSLAVFYGDICYEGDLLFYTPPGLILFLIGLALWLLIATITSIFPKRFTIPIALLIVTRLAIGFPLNNFLANNPACLIVDFLLIIFTLAYFVISLFKQLELFRKREVISIKHTVTMIVVGLILGVASIPFIGGGLARGMQNTFGDYTRFSFSKISMVERIFEKDGIKVFLIGMMHIGEPEFYQQINQYMAIAPEDGKRAILMEAVTDETDILPERFKTGETYGALAEKLGIEVQSLGKENVDPDASKEGWIKGDIEYIHADIDVSELSPEHQKLLVQMLKLVDKGPMAAATISPEDFTPQNLEDLMMEGIIRFRNDRLMQKFNYAVDRGDIKEIYIPWGAAHLGDIEERLIKMGYSQTSELVRPVLPYKRLVRMVFH